MFKLAYLISRKEGLCRESFQTYCLHTHGPLVKNIPNIKGFVVNLTQDEAEHDAIVELWFADMQAFAAAQLTDEARVAMEDHENFVNTSRTRVLSVVEHVLI